jgi:hypothetical protein
MVPSWAVSEFGLVEEGADKRRIFAIGNYIKDRLLPPYHDWLMTIFSRIPMDGTFNQTAPLNRWKGKKELFSFDLKAATDSLPVDLSGSMLAVGRSVGSVVVLYHD